MSVASSRLLDEVLEQRFTLGARCTTLAIEEIGLLLADAEETTVHNHHCWLGVAGLPVYSQRLHLVPLLQVMAGSSESHMRLRDFAGPPSPSYQL